MVTSVELKDVRRTFARRIMEATNLVAPRLEDAFAEVPRENFLAPGPWHIRKSGQAYNLTPDASPAHLYADVIVAIDRARRVSNGRPGFHAYLLGRAYPSEGEHAVHIGAGTGYYSAIIARMVGPTGRVTAVEFEADLAALAARNLTGYSNVAVIHGDGTGVGFDAADVIYVNTGVTRPADIWLDRLRDGGRIILPLTSAKSAGSPVPQPQGAIFQITRKGQDFLARWIAPISIHASESLRDEASERALSAAFQHGDVRRVTRLYRTDDLADGRCWLKAPGWALAYD
jgi:protein-L-isoaspartate(D-aspartate) O-methyltransferase